MIRSSVSFQSTQASSRQGSRVLSSVVRFLLPACLVALTLASTGCTKKVTVPNVKGMEPEQAKATLVAASLKPGNITGGSGSFPPGTHVLTQSPDVGQQVAANSAVDLVVEVPVTVPSVTGATVAEAVSQLQQLGLRVAFVNRSTPNPLAKPKIEEQNPPANSTVSPNTMVTLSVSTYSGPDIGALLGLVEKEPAYQKLKPEYKKVLDAFLGNPSTPRSMDEAPAPGNPTN
jgi:beta-lactam-binding protein with PASTA domain